MDAPEKDRITLAWELRRDIHAWLKKNPRSMMSEIFAAFAHRKCETVRKAVIRLRYDGDAAMVGRRKVCNQGVYSSITPRIKGEDKKREALAAGARKSQPMAAAACRKDITLKSAAAQRRLAGKARKEAERTEEKARREAAAAEPWRTVHVGGQLHASQAGSGGQGAVRERVYANCFHLF